MLNAITKDLASYIADNFGTPLFIMDECGLVARFQAFKKAVQSRYAHAEMAISYKTNLLHGLLALLHEEGAHAEVVSGIEYLVAKKLILPDQKIIFNGPMKLTEELMQAINDRAYINCDHEDEIHHIEQIARSLNRRVAIGIRVYFDQHDLKWNRFGFPLEANGLHPTTFKIIQQIIHSDYLQLSGVHAHIGTNIRELKYFANLGRDLSCLAWELKSQFQLELDYIDVGGGLAGISPRVEEPEVFVHPLPDLEAYAEAIIAPLLPYLSSLKKPAKLFFEPGRTLFEPYGALLTKVVGRRPVDKDGLPGCICDAGINTLATSYAYNFPVQVFSEALPQKEMRLFGPTCNQKDQLCSPRLLPMLKIGDLLIFYGVGSYCMAFSYSFIRLRPGVVLWRGGNEVTWLRKPETLEHLAPLECIQPIKDYATEIT